MTPSASARGGVRLAVLAAGAILFLSFSPAFAATIHVAPGGTGDGSVGNPAGPQAALDTARTNGEDDTIKLQAGTYTFPASPAPALVYDSDSNDNHSVVLSGGWDANFLTRTGDPADTIIDGEDARRLFQILAESAGVTIDFTIEDVTFKNGAAASTVGAGLYAEQSDGGKLSLTIRNCVFSGNDAGSNWGGGLHSACTLVVEESKFLSNSANSGGAVVLTYYSPDDSSSITAQFTDCHFEGNTATGWQGSTIFNNVTLDIHRCTFRGVAGGGSSGIGSPLYSQGTASLKVTNSTFENFLTDTWGSAIEFWHCGGEVINCLFRNMRAGDSDIQARATIDIYDTDQSVRIAGCTFYQCYSAAVTDYGGAIYVRDTDVATVHNCVFWDCGPRPAYNGSGTRSPVMGHCFLDTAFSLSNFVDGGGILDQQSTSPFSGPSLQPAAGSAIIDAGDNTHASPQFPDLLGNGRIFDGDDDGTATVDMGAYEFAPDVAVDPPDMNLGSVEVGQESPPHMVTVGNSGQAPLTVGTIVLNGPDAADFEIRNDGASGQTIPSGGSETFEVVFKPGSSGAKQASADVPSDDPDTPSLSTTLQGFATSPPILPVSPAKGAIGTEITLEGTGFGAKKPKVWLESTSSGKTKTKKKKLKVLTHSDTKITCLMSAKLPSGTYALKVKPKVKGAAVIDLGVFEIAGPEAGTLSKTTGAPKDSIDVTGKYFGDRKAKVKVYFVYTDPKKGKEKKKKCKVVKDSITFDPVTGESSLKILVPKAPDVKGSLVLENKHGSVTLTTDFTVGSGGG